MNEHLYKSKSLIHEKLLLAGGTMALFVFFNRDTPIGWIVFYLLCCLFIFFLSLYLVPIFWNFCGIYTLKISEEKITKMLAGKTVWEIDYDKVYVKLCLRYGQYCAIYSKSPLTGMDSRSISQLLRSKEAVFYPWITKIEEDFPELYQKAKIESDLKF